jgi:hypothetical protein
MYVQGKQLFSQEFSGIIHAHRICYVAFLVVFAGPRVHREPDGERGRGGERQGGECQGYVTFRRVGMKMQKTTKMLQIAKFFS